MGTKAQLFHYEQWLNFKSEVRGILRGMNLLEVETPYLVDGPAFEDQLEAFSTGFEFGSTQKTYYLPTSPEIHLKKLVAMGFEEIFEIKSCFRNGELSNHHEPEFTMLEWYRVGASLSQIKSDVIHLVQELKKKNLLHFSESSWLEMSYSELFFQYTGFHLTSSVSLAEISNLAQSLGLNPDGSENLIELLDWIFVHKIEPGLKQNKTWVIVHSYPPGASSLAKINNEGWSDRFELYFCGMELANAFCELVDYEEHEERWRRIAINRKSKGLKELGRDEEFFSIIKQGLPPCSGVALGMERLFMACTGLASIRDFKPFAKNKDL